MIITTFAIVGVTLAFIIHSNYYLAKVSKGLNPYQLFILSIQDPIEDELLRYTFFNLFMAQVCLFITLLGLGAILGVFIWTMV